MVRRDEGECVILFKRWLGGFALKVFRVVVKIGWIRRAIFMSCSVSEGALELPLGPLGCCSSGHLTLSFAIEHKIVYMG